MSDYFTRAAATGGALKRVISGIYPELSYNVLMMLIRKRDVWVNGIRSGENTTVMAGDSVGIFLRPSAVPLKIIFENDNILVAYKPKGITSDGEYSFAGLVSYCRPGAVLIHRLDTNTDGLLLFSKTAYAEKLLLAAMKHGEIKKTYRAVVYGEVNFNHRCLSAYLVKDAEKGRVKLYDHPVEGAERVSLFATTVCVKNGCTELSVEISGGKTHQIRAQLSYAGYFILGDGKYGNDRINRLYGKKSQELTATEICFCLADDPLGLNGIAVKL